METPDKFKSSAYWTQFIQLKICNDIRRFLEENNLLQTDFAERLGVSEEYVAEIMNGDFNQSLSELVELALACGMIPKLEFVPARFAENVVADTYLNPIDGLNKKV